MTNQELIELIQAQEDGKTIQFLRFDNIWIDKNNDLSFGFDPNSEYRIKPEPREFWLITGKRGDCSIVVSEKPDSALLYEVIHVREIIE